MNKRPPSANQLLHLPWDSNFFGFNIGRIYAQMLTATDLQCELEKASPLNIQFVELFCDVTDSQSIYASERLGFHLVDIRITLINPLQPQPIPPATPTAPLFKKAVLDDLSRLHAIGNGLFQLSRYYRYPKFDRAKIDRMFQIWIEKSITGELDDELYYLCNQTEILAFCSLKYREKDASVGVFGVNPTHQGKGLGSLLLKHVFQLLAQRQITQLDIITQGNNFGALHLYQKNGFFYFQDRHEFLQMGGVIQHDSL